MLSFDLRFVLDSGHDLVGRKWFEVRKWGQIKESFKNYEIELLYVGWSTLFDLSIDTQWKGVDHGGLRFELTILGVYFGAAIYDRRHWDDEKNTWMDPTASLLHESDFPEHDQHPFVLAAHQYLAERGSGLRRTPTDPATIIRGLVYELEATQSRVFKDR